MAPSLRVPLWTKRLGLPPEPVCEGRRETRGANTPQAHAHLLFPFYCGVETPDFPALDRAWPLWPGPAPVRPRPLRLMAAAAGTAAEPAAESRRQRPEHAGPDAPTPPPSAPRTPRPAPQRSRRLSTSARLRTRYPSPRLHHCSQRRGRGLWRGQRSAPLLPRRLIRSGRADLVSIFGRTAAGEKTPSLTRTHCRGRRLEEGASRPAFRPGAAGAV